MFWGNVKIDLHFVLLLNTVISTDRLNFHLCNKSSVISMGKCKKDATPLLTHWSYVSLALAHQYVQEILGGHMLGIRKSWKWKFYMLFIDISSSSCGIFIRWMAQDFSDGKGNGFLPSVYKIELGMDISWCISVALPTCTPEWLPLINTQPASSMQKALISLGCTTKARNPGILPWYTIARLRQDQLPQDSYSEKVD